MFGYKTTGNKVYEYEKSSGPGLDGDNEGEFDDFEEGNDPGDSE